MEEKKMDKNFFITPPRCSQTVENKSSYAKRRNMNAQTLPLDVRGSWRELSIKFEKIQTKKSFGSEKTFFTHFFLTPLWITFFYNKKCHTIFFLLLS